MKRSTLVGWCIWSAFLVSYAYALDHPAWNFHPLLGWIVALDIVVSVFVAGVLCLYVCMVRLHAPTTRKILAEKFAQDPIGSAKEFKTFKSMVFPNFTFLMGVGILSSILINAVLFLIGFEMAALVCFLAALATYLVRLTVEPVPEIKKLWE